MEERTKLLVALGAATAANCIPCFEYLYCEAGVAGLTQEEIQEVVALATKVKQGAHVALKSSINDIMGIEEKYDLPCSGKATSSCDG
jgi:alkylhydroperoxidase/carboxymuconolactone decarboxylase family protein YurZ